MLSKTCLCSDIPLSVWLRIRTIIVKHADSLISFKNIKNDYIQRVPKMYTHTVYNILAPSVLMQTSLGINTEALTALKTEFYPIYMESPL